eukprot:408921_1
MALSWWDPSEYLITKELCFNCNKQLSKLSKCGRCHSAYYCNQKCQKLDYANHKTYCLQYKKLNSLMNQERRILENANENYFEPYTIGHFWSLAETRNYCQARYTLAEHILVYAECKETQKIYETGLAHFMELLRLIHGDNMGLRDQVPFILLKLNRDNDAYNFIKWWDTIDPNGTYDWGNPPQNTKQAFLASLYLIKMRTILRLKSVDTQISEVKNNLKLLKTRENIMITDIIHSYLTGGNKTYVNKLINDQRKHAKKYLCQMLKNNKVFVQSLVNPDPLRQMNPPSGYSQGSGEEAYLVMYRCWRLFDRIPGVKQMIIQKVGEYPQYKPEFVSFNWNL